MHLAGKLLKCWLSTMNLLAYKVRSLKRSFTPLLGVKKLSFKFVNQLSSGTSSRAERVWLSRRLMSSSKSIIKRRRASSTAMCTLITCNYVSRVLLMHTMYSIVCDALNEDIPSKDWISSVHLTG